VSKLAARAQRSGSGAAGCLIHARIDLDSDHEHHDGSTPTLSSFKRVQCVLVCISVECR